MFNYGFDNLNIEGGYGSTKLHDIVFYLAVFAALLCLVSRKYRWKKFLIVFGSLTIGIICYIKGGNTNLIILLFAVMLADKTDIDKALKFIFTERLVIFLFIVVGSLVGLFENSSVDIEKWTYSGASYSLGFGHPNSLASQAGFLMLLYLAIHRYSLKFGNLLLVFIADCFIFTVSRSRTAFILILLAIIGSWAIKSGMFRRFWAKCVPVFYPCLMIFMFLMIGLEGILGFYNPAFTFINDGLFNGRVGLAGMYLSTYSLTPFGQNLDMTIIARNSYYALDNGYIYILMYYGIIGFLMFAAIYQGTMMHLLKEEEYFLTFICAISMVWGLYEAMMISLSGNFALLFLGALFSKYRFGNKKSSLKESYEDETMDYMQVTKGV